MAYVRGGQQSSRAAGTAEGAGAARGADLGGRSAGATWRPIPPLPADMPDDGEFDWERVGIFGAGIALGALLGVGVTLFTAPVSGQDARQAVRRRARRAVWSGRDAWEDLRDELAAATLRKKKDLRRRKRRVRAAWSDDTLD